MKSKLEQLTEAICDVVSDLGCGCGKGHRIRTRDIQLADVLRAIGGNTICVTGAGNFANINDLTWLADWDLSKPLHLQSEETIDFLHSIICNK